MILIRSLIVLFYLLVGTPWILLYFKFVPELFLAALFLMGAGILLLPKAVQDWNLE